ncbi:MAG: SDR family oxidoreductase [Planctomycetota bacterium]
MITGLDDQVVCVLGAARGIGHEVAKAFVSEGCQVYAGDIDDRVHDLEGESVRTSTVDVTQIDQIKRMADSANDTAHVIFCVAVPSGKFGYPYWNVEPSLWQRVIDVNLLGAVNAAHVFGPRLAKRKAGSLQFFVSVAGQIGSQTDPPYSASKAALINFMQCVAKDLAPYGVRANAIAPGMVQTDLNRSVWRAACHSPDGSKKSYDDWAAEKIRSVSPLGQWQEPEAIAATSVFLASDHARHITGQTINIDGGQVMHS